MAHPGRGNAILASLCVAGLAYALLQSLVAPALPLIQDELGASSTGVTWVMTAFLLGGAVATPIIGRAGDIYGKRRALLATLGIVAFGGAIAAESTSLSVMVLGRGLQGLGGGIFPLAFAIVRDQLPAKRVSVGVGVLSAMLGAGAGLGLVISGVIVEGLSYHSLFWLPTGVALAAAVGVAISVAESPVSGSVTLNWSSALLLSLGVALPLVAVDQTSSWGLISVPWALTCLLGALALVLWFRTEVRSRDPLVDVRLLRSRQVLCAQLIAGLMGFGMFAVFVLGPQMLELPRSTGYGLGASVVEAGAFMAPTMLGIFGGGILAGWAVRTVEVRMLLIGGSLAACAGFLCLAVGDRSPAEILLGMSLIGIGVGIGFAAIAMLVVDSVPSQQMGIANGMTVVMRLIGAAIGGQLGAAVLAASANSGGFPGESGFTDAFWMGAGALVAAAAVAAMIPRRHGSTGPSARRGGGAPSLLYSPKRQSLVRPYTGGAHEQEGGRSNG
jgi:MFS family permease